jgi:hypothetical protein
VAEARLLGLGGLAPTTTETAARKCAAVELRNVKKVPPYPDPPSVRFKRGGEWARSGRDLGGVGRKVLAPFGRARRPLDEAALAQDKILEDEPAITGRERTTAGAAGNLVIDGFGSGFMPYDLVQSITVRAGERRSVGRHNASRGSLNSVTQMYGA